MKLFGKFFIIFIMNESHNRERERERERVKKLGTIISILGKLT